jgi:hypothetical protein
MGGGERESKGGDTGREKRQREKKNNCDTVNICIRRTQEQKARKKET